MFRSVVLRARRALQGAPAVGTIRGRVSALAPDSQGSAVSERFAILERETLTNEQPLANPAVVTTERSPAVAWVMENVTFWPETGAAVDSRRRVVVETVFHPRLDRLVQTGGFRHHPIATESGLCAALHLGPIWDNYYHWLVDCLPRLYALHDPRVQALGRVRLYVSNRLSAERRELLARLVPANTELVFVSPKLRVQARRWLFLPFLSGSSAAHLPPSYVEFFRERLGVPKPSDAPNRVLISRQRATSRKLLNHDQLSAALAPLGFQSVALEDLSMQKQIELFANTQVVVGVHGAGLTNTLFSRECRVLELFPGQPQLHYRWLAHALGHRYASLSELASGNAAKNADVHAPVDRVLSQLEALGRDA